MAFHQPSVFPSRCYLEKCFIRIYINKLFDPGRTLNVLLKTKKIFSKTHYHAHFYGNRYFLPPYHTLKNETIKNDIFLVYKVFLSPVVILKIILNISARKYFIRFFVVKSTIYYSFKKFREN